MNESYFDRELREAKIADRDAFIESHKQELQAAWPELWAEPEEKSMTTERCEHDR